MVTGIGLAVGSPLMIFRLVRSWWVRRRLVVGSDCLQVVEHLGGEDTVVLQIPYANIAEFKYEKGARRVGIDLHCLDDPNTYAGGENFRGNRQSDGRHYCILVGYRSGPRAIATELERAYLMWVEKFD
jgi:hypothetical protein